MQHTRTISQASERTGNWLANTALVFRRLLRIEQRRDRSLRLVESLVLGRGAVVHVVECAGQRFLVGAGVSSPVALSRGSLQTDVARKA